MARKKKKTPTSSLAMCFIKTYLAQYHDDHEIHDGTRNRYNGGGIILEIRVLVKRMDDKQLVHNHSNHEQHNQGHLTHKTEINFG